MVVFWVAVAVIAWIAISVVVAILVGRAIRLRDLTDGPGGHTGDGENRSQVS